MPCCDCTLTSHLVSDVFPSFTEVIIKCWVSQVAHEATRVIHVQGKDKNSRETRNVHRLLIGKAYFKGKVKEDDSRKKSFLKRM